MSNLMPLSRCNMASIKLSSSSHKQLGVHSNGFEITTLRKGKWQAENFTLALADRAAAQERKCHDSAEEDCLGGKVRHSLPNSVMAEMCIYSSRKNLLERSVAGTATVDNAPLNHLALPFNSSMSRMVLAGVCEKETRRRQALLVGGLLPALLLCLPPVSNAVVAAAKIDSTKAPTHPFDAADGRLREAASLFQRALSAPTVEEEEKLWTEVIDRYGKLDAEWVPDIVSRAWGNRGNSRSRQGKMEQALEDFDRSIELAPYAADPVLNRGVTLESLGRFEEAAADYQAVLAAQPNDPAAWNNLGNVKAALRQWDEALLNYHQAVQLAPEFSFAAANYALALYQVGKENEAFKLFRSLLRKYPEFPDVRAALAVALYAQGLIAEAETNWGRMEDGRYRDRNWVRYTRKWPPRLVNALEGFLDVKAVTAS